MVSEKHWVINLTASGQKKLKNEYAVRVVPIHKDLIKLGFLNFCEHMKRKGEERLFPELKPNKTGDEYGRKLGRWFNGSTSKNGYKRECGINSPRKTFHCFRHTLINYAKQKELNTLAFHEITGHSKKGTVQEMVYEKSYEPKYLKSELDKVKFEYNIDAIKKWD